MDVRYSPDNQLLYAEPFPQHEFVDGVSDYVEERDVPAKVQFYDDLFEDFAAEDDEEWVLPRQMRDRLEEDLPGHEGVNVRIQAGPQSDTVLAYEGEKLTVRVEHPERHGAPGVEAVVAEYFPSVADELRNE